MKSHDRLEQRRKADRGTLATRSWKATLGLSAAVTAAAVVFSATVNPLLGRAVHWDWMAVVGPAVFLVLALALRKRWV